MMVIDAESDADQVITIAGKAIGRVEIFKFLGSIVTNDSNSPTLDWRLSLCWENSRKRSTTTFNQRDKYFFCIYCIHKLFKLTFAYMFSVISDL